MDADIAAKDGRHTKRVPGNSPARIRNNWWERDRLLTAGSVLSFFAALGYTRGVLPLHVSSIRAGDIVVGTTAAANPLGELGMRWMTAYILGRHGTKAVMLACALWLLCANLAYSFTRSIGSVVFLTFIHGVAVGGFVTAAITGAVAGAESDDPRIGALSAFSVARLVGQYGAPAIGLSLATHMRTGAVLAWGAVGGAVAFVTALFAKSRQSGTRFADSPSIVLSTVREALGHREVVGAVLAYFAWSVTYASTINFLPLLGRERGIMNVGVFPTASCICTILGTLFLGVLVARFGRNRVLRTSGVLIIASLTAVLLARRSSQLAFAGVLYGLGTFAVFPCLATAVVSGVPNATGVAVALFMSGLDLGLSVGAVGLGVVARAAGYSGVYIVAALTYCVGLATYYVLGSAGTARAASGLTNSSTGS